MRRLLLALLSASLPAPAPASAAFGMRDIESDSRGRLRFVLPAGESRVEVSRRGF